MSHHKQCSIRMKVFESHYNSPRSYTDCPCECHKGKPLSLKQVLKILGVKA